MGIRDENAGRYVMLTEAQREQRKRKAERKRIAQSQKAKKQQELNKKRAEKEANKTQVEYTKPKLEQAPLPVLEENDPVVELLKTFILPTHEFVDAEIVRNKSRDPKAPKIQVKMKVRQKGKTRTTEHFYNYRKLLKQIIHGVHRDMKIDKKAGEQLKENIAAAKKAKAEREKNDTETANQ